MSLLKKAVQWFLGLFIPWFAYVEPLTREEMERKWNELLSLGSVDKPYREEEQKSPLMQLSEKVHKRLEIWNHGLLVGRSTRAYAREVLGRKGLLPSEEQRNKEKGLDPELKHLHPRARQLALKVKRRSEQYRAAARARKN